MLYIYHFSIAFAFVYILRFFQQRFSSLFALRHVPGPKSSSWVWGEEKVLYYNTPGALYLDWHRTYGNVVKFTGAFGVRAFCSNFVASLTTLITHQHQLLSVTDPYAISFILGEGAYQFPKPKGVRAWFRMLLGEGILWVEGNHSIQILTHSLMCVVRQRSSLEATA